MPTLTNYRTSDYFSIGNLNRENGLYFYVNCTLKCHRFIVSVCVYVRRSFNLLGTHLNNL